MALSFFNRGKSEDERSEMSFVDHLEVLRGHLFRSVLAILVGAVIISFAMQLAVIYWPPVTAVFRTVPLSWYDWVLVGIFSAWGQVLSYMVTFLRQRFIRRFSVVRVG